MQLTRTANIHSALLRSVALVAAIAGLSCCATLPAAGRSSPRIARAAPFQGNTCLTTTGSRIPPRPGECLAVPGRSYGGEDIERTGAVQPAQALSLLDPDVTAH